ncbi:hypothetical protein GCM10012275_16330 [Longimycelium tulufanense]|uniref:PPM-type phosphatase domain-containing protein n=1 Tax=Longimycelium tulufanense TaxID=907463 RepID=A0A8J3FVM8_9PSEU|nr:protein phosphatase 2C domain-containing protein [Longimycelium tulufanense]GGM46069.1 hypothetical protein GCM10012275_16330 [Longimycelium tulufanense]
MALTLHYVARSDRGLTRSVNEDSVFASPRLLAVADGMGGHIAGEVASRAVITELAKLDEADPGPDLLDQLRDAVLAGNAAIADLMRTEPDLQGMGTTLTAMVFTGTGFGVVNVGDSRIYALGDGTLQQVTRDDSVVQSLVDEGHITPEEARTHPHRSLVLRAMVGQPDLEPTLSELPARAGERYLLCSDGLTDLLPDEVLAELLAVADLAECADGLIERALDEGGTDNVTVIVADVVEGPNGQSPPSQDACREGGQDGKEGRRRQRLLLISVALLVLTACALVVLLPVG